MNILVYGPVCPPFAVAGKLQPILSHTTHKAASGHIISLQKQFELSQFTPRS